MSGIHGFRVVHLLPSIKLLEFALDFGFDGFGFGLGVEDDFELALVSEEGAEGLGVVAGGAAFLDAGVAGEGG